MGEDNGNQNKIAVVCECGQRFSIPMPKAEFSNNVGNYPLAVGSRLGYAPLEEREENIPVTVCIACIAENGIVLGASDRMLTAGDIQFEPGDVKIRRLTNSITIQTAADSDLHDEIYQSVVVDVRDRIDLFPDEWWSVKEIAEMYAKYYSDVHSKRAERALLAPLRLTIEDFLDRQQTMDSELVARLTSEIINYDAGAVQAIVAGIDQTGPHLWLVKNDKVRCLDRVGFVAIGAGEWHAKSQFMFAEYGRFTSVTTAMRLIYSAKKRAEVAPGVGEATDMFYIGPGLGSFTWFQNDVMQKLDEVYKKLRAEEDLAALTANMEVDKYAEELAKAAAEAAALKEQEATTTIDGGESSSDQKRVRDGVETVEPETAETREETEPS